jgi:hypothetical protein
MSHFKGCQLSDTGTASDARDSIYVNGWLAWCLVWIRRGLALLPFSYPARLLSQSSGILLWVTARLSMSKSSWMGIEQPVEHQLEVAVPPPRGWPPKCKEPRPRPACSLPRVSRCKPMFPLLLSLPCFGLDKSLPFSTTDSATRTSGFSFLLWKPANLQNTYGHETLFLWGQWVWDTLPWGSSVPSAGLCFAFSLHMHVHTQFYAFASLLQPCGMQTGV